MTARELYEYALIECNKLEAPSLLLEDYNYFINKAVQQYVDATYKQFEIGQQSTDDLRVLKTTTRLEISFENNRYISKLPHDYMHILNCIVELESNSNKNCYNVNDSIQITARRLTSDMHAGILNNAYYKPSYKRPYYQIINFNTQSNLPTNPNMDDQIKERNISNIDSLKTTNRNSNVTDVILEIKVGKDSQFIPKYVDIDYIKSPQHIRLTQRQIDTTKDLSQIIEFPDYVCYQIVNIFTRLVLENANDPRLQTIIPINNPTPSGN